MGYLVEVSIQVFETEELYIKWEKEAERIRKGNKNLSGDGGEGDSRVGELTMVNNFKI